jgi:hypothetical protein
MKLLPLVLIACATLSAAERWVPLFDGKTLKGWEVCNGFAKYEAVDGTIVGTTAEGSPNSFLCTTKEYGDFILEFEAWTDPVLNSGVQIRSHRYSGEAAVTVFDGQKFAARKFPKDRVYGYQVEISNGAKSGGIYDEARRGWIAQVPAGSESEKLYKDNGWNRYRVEAMGDRIKVFVNGAMTTDVTDSVDLTGFIGLQVHQFKGEKPAQVRWRNVRIQDLGKHVWQPMWSGKDLKGWTTQGGASITVEDGAAHLVSTEKPEIGMMLTQKPLKDFTVRMKFEILKGNSGVFLRTDPKDLASYEVEVDSEKRTGGFWETGPNGRKWVTGPEDNRAVKAGEWNELTASLHGHRIVFHVNGIKTLDLPNDTQGRLEGVIGLQAHGSRRPTDVWYKDIELLEKAKR